jgi:polyhydroxybutyrate depolymerase
MRIPKSNGLALMAVFLLAGSAACGRAGATPTATADGQASPVLSATAASVSILAVDTKRTLTVGDMTRTCRLHVPAGLSIQKPAPLVFVFHGFQENGSYAQIYTGLDGIADDNGFIAVYPDGSGSRDLLSWNASGCCGDALLNDVDEPAFVRSIIADVQTIAGVDARRTYATGFSNGALLSYRLACTMSDTFAAVAPVGRTLTYAPCQPQQPVSLIDVHGMNDQVVPFEGGGTGIQFPSVKGSLAAWAKLDNCGAADQGQKDGIMTHITYGGCVPGVSVDLYKVEGVGHGWPPPEVAPVSQIIWDFFAAHPKP